MKTKTFLTILGLVVSQSFFNSCNEDSINAQTEDISSETNKTEINNYDGPVSTQNYFANPEPFNGAVSFIISTIGSQGASYDLTQNDLNLFYNKAQIPINERLSLDQVNQLIVQTTNSFQTPVSQIVQQLPISNVAKSLIISIDTQSIPNVEGNSSFQNLSATEKTFINNFNNLQFGIEQGIILPISSVSKDPFGPKSQLGAKIGFLIGCVISGITLNPGPAFAGSLIGAVVGGMLDKK
jgi:hypothetical protein